MVTPIAKRAENTGMEGGSCVYPKIAKISRVPPTISRALKPKKGMAFVFFCMMEYTMKTIANTIYSGAII